MRLRLSQLRKIIKEEVSRALHEGSDGGDDYFGMPGAPSAAEVAAGINADHEYFPAHYDAEECAAEWDGANEGKEGHPFVGAVARELKKLGRA